MGSYYRKNSLSVWVDEAAVPAGINVHVEPGSLLGFRAGRLVVYNPMSGLTIAPADIPNVAAYRIGVGHNPNGGMMATEIRHVGHLDINLCDTYLKVNVQKPQLALPQVIDFEFDCTFTGDDVMVQIDIDDWITRSYFQEGQTGSLLYNLRTDIEGCDSCSEEENCAKIACQLAAKIRGDFIKYFTGTSKLGLDTSKPMHGLWAAQKFTNEVTIDLAPSAVTSEGCTAVKGLKTITTAGLADLDLSTYVDPSNITQTLSEQLSVAISAINTWLKGKGTAYLKKTDADGDTSCGWQIAINTCDTGVTLTYHDDATDTGTVTAAFAAHTIDDMCDNCDPAGQVTYTCGVRIFVDPLALPCNCSYPDGNQPSYYGREVQITAFGPGWDKKSYKIIEQAPMQVPLGTGYQVQQVDFSQSNGGPGFDYPYSEMYSDDRIPLPLQKSAAAQASWTNCEAMYCVWSIVTQDMEYGPRSRGVLNSQTMTNVNIPRAFVNAPISFQEILTQIQGAAGAGRCNVINLECVAGE